MSRLLLLVFGLAAVMLFGRLVLAQDKSAASTGTNGTVGAMVPPPPTPPKSPVEAFRELLSMPPIQRQRQLAGRSPENRKLVMAKIREYQNMSAEERDLRLKATELRWYLWPLIKTPATNRAERVQAIPPEMRQLVEDRLRVWDLLPKSFQEKMLTNEVAIKYFSELPDRTKVADPQSRTNLPPHIQKALSQWDTMTETQRAQVVNLVRGFLDLTPAEQDKTLRTLSEQEQHAIEKTLDVFRQLSPQQRVLCLRNFKAFADFAPEERVQFLHNAQKWEKMTPTDRQIFKQLVENTSLQPVPPTMTAPIPPPPRSIAPRTPETATTNN